eukprot:CAMPEP_0197638202 /NCGR_PEP_ID=MMETSP1338-20131121/13199_1 /TAXON_ID=43686 ORGANISM="Pelagodinium beii, Strain RCC1491" /NCGR_SAMPLE_ID=MMETSP1338 /ASSEMBLY_ACC=CAM_ASM_000754 /LENGTH=399 /DNA_ID=CAMNT_0043210745 /DNA_START=15 /DNA_END=1217 /DNA_ORIENTATION=-
MAASSQPEKSWLSAGVLTQRELNSFSHASFSDAVTQAVAHYNVPAGAIALKCPGGMRLYARSGIRHTFIPQASDGRDPMCLHHTGVDCPTIIEDTKQCKRVEKDVLVAQEPHVRFFAGAPLKRGQMVFGTLCIFDWTPKVLSLTACEMLSQLACQIADIFCTLKKSKVLSIRLRSNLSLRSLMSTSQDSLSSTESEEDKLSDTDDEEECHNEKEVQIEPRARKSTEKFISEATTAAETAAESLGSASPSDSEPVASLRSLTWHAGVDGITPDVCDWSRCHLLTSKRSFTEGDETCTDPVRTISSTFAQACDKERQVAAREKACAATSKCSMQPSSWSEMSLFEFLQLLALEKHHSDFEKEEIDMQSLRLLSDEDMTSLGLKLGPRRIIQAALASHLKRS